MTIWWLRCKQTTLQYFLLLKNDIVLLGKGEGKLEPTFLKLLSQSQSSGAEHTMLLSESAQSELVFMCRTCHAIVLVYHSLFFLGLAYRVHTNQLPFETMWKDEPSQSRVCDSPFIWSKESLHSPDADITKLPPQSKANNAFVHFLSLFLKFFQHLLK